MRTSIIDREKQQVLTMKNNVFLVDAIDRDEF